MPETYEGDDWADKAVQALEQKRADQARQRPRLPEAEDEDEGVTKLRWQDGRPENTPITLKQGAEAYSAYRNQLANDVLAGMQSDFDAAQAAESPPVETEQQTEQQGRTPEQEWSEYYSGLQPEQRAYVDAAVQHQQKAVETQQAADTYHLALSDLLLRLNGVSTNAFSDIHNENDIAKLAQENPQRFQALQAHLQNVNAVRSEAQRFTTERQQQQQAQFQENYKAFSAQQDREAEKLIPELSANADPQAQHRLKKGAIDTLRAAGFSDSELYSAWAQGQPIYLRDARAQRILASAARWEMANSQAAKNDLRSKRAPPVPVQRPGVSADNYESHNERALSERLQRTHSIHDAVKLLEARRSSGRR